MERVATQIRTIVGMVLAAGSVATLGGCFFQRLEREYVSNDALLHSLAEEAGYRVDPERFRLVAADVHRDVVTFQYQGVEFAGDRAWVIRFSEKSTEQNPEALREVYPFLDVLREEHRGFRLVVDSSTHFDRLEASYVTYEFASPVRDATGQPLRGHGVLASIGGPSGGGFVYQIKLDNHGDRETRSWDDLAPFVSQLAIPGSASGTDAVSAP